MQDLSLQKALIINLQSTISEKHRKTSRRLCRKMGKTRRSPCECMQENSRTCETMESWDQMARWPCEKVHKHDAAVRQAQFGNQWYIFRTTAGGSNTIPGRQHLELGQASRARIDFLLQSSGDRWPISKFLFRSTINAIAGSFFLSQNAINNLAI